MRFPWTCLANKRLMYSLLHVGCRGQITCNDQSPKEKCFWVLVDLYDSNLNERRKTHGKLSRMAEEELNAESKIILETYGKKVDYVDFNTLQPIVSIL